MVPNNRLCLLSLRESDLVSSSEYSAIDLIPNSPHARITLRAISPLFAISRLSIFFANQTTFLKIYVPMLLRRSTSFLFVSAIKAAIIMGLVSIGSITISMMPFSAVL